MKTRSNYRFCSIAQPSLVYICNISVCQAPSFLLCPSINEFVTKTTAAREREPNQFKFAREKVTKTLSEHHMFRRCSRFIYAMYHRRRCVQRQIGSILIVCCWAGLNAIVHKSYGPCDRKRGNDDHNNRDMRPIAAHAYDSMIHNVICFV